MSEHCRINKENAITLYMTRAKNYQRMPEGISATATIVYLRLTTLATDSFLCKMHTHDDGNNITMLERADLSFLSLMFVNTA